MQVASNRVAEAFFTDLFDNLSGSNASEWALPSFERLGLADAASATSSDFDGDIAAWSGALLFPYLGEDRYFVDWILTNDVVSEDFDDGPRTVVNQTGTYNLVTLIDASFVAGRAAGLSGIDDFLQAIGVVFGGDPAGINPIYTDQTNLIDATNAYFAESYGLSADNPITPGSELTFARGLSAFGPDYEAGTIGDDVLRFTGDVVLHAGEGDDIIFSNARDDALIDGGDGNDVVDYSGDIYPYGVRLVVEDVDDIGGKERPIYDQRVVASPFNDPLFGEHLIYGVEALVGTSLGDRLEVNTLSSDIAFDLGEGVDQLDLSGMAYGVDAVFDGAGGGTVTRMGGGATLRVEGVEGVSAGTDHDDVLRLDGAIGGELDGGAGEDLLDGGSGEDRLFGGEGDDELDGGFGADLLRGEAGADVFVDVGGDDARDVLIGGSGQDRYQLSDAITTGLVYDVYDPTAESIAAFAREHLASIDVVWDEDLRGTFEFGSYAMNIDFAGFSSPSASHFLHQTDRWVGAINDVPPGIRSRG